MFTGIIESTGIVRNVRQMDDKYLFRIESSFVGQLKIGDSVAHDGVCLTVTSIIGQTYDVVVIDTTLAVTNINWQVGSLINLERAMQAGGRLDGHIVQGHVDTTGLVSQIEEQPGSVKITVNIPTAFSDLIIDKGSICLNGISLTIVQADMDRFSVAIIPHTWQVTNLNNLKVGNKVNLEFDVIGKYVRRIQQVHTNQLKGQTA